jgi:hypothetical protein
MKILKQKFPYHECEWRLVYQKAKHYLTVRGGIIDVDERLDRIQITLK